MVGGRSEGVGGLLRREKIFSAKNSDVDLYTFDIAKRKAAVDASHLTPKLQTPSIS